MSRRTILDLCSGTGSWSAPYVNAGYNVIRVTLPEQDVRTDSFHVERVHGILAAPPCTYLTHTSQWMRRSALEMWNALSVVDACLRAVAIYRPKWWALENPPGVLKRYLGAPNYSFQPWWFGGNRRKRTWLWGDFEAPERNVFEPPIGLVSTGQLGQAGDLRRSITPPEFAKAFMEANP